MPQQLIYTSAQRGVVAGRSGYCTVARSATMREALVLQLEKFSYYQHLSLSGGKERRIYSYRVLDIRNSRFYVLSRIQDAGLDFTGRTNFLAHHLIFTPEEIRQFASPPVILRGWTGWLSAWTKDPEQLENEAWSNLTELSAVVSVPARTWQQITGDASNGFGLLEARSGISFRVDGLTEDQILELFSESLELLELRDPRKDFRASAWQYTFTTSMQEQDNPADFRWRCLHSDNPASSRFAGPDCRPLSDVRTQRVTNEEKVFAQSGRQPPWLVIQPQNVCIKEGDTMRLIAKAEGVPAPRYQWYSVDRNGNGQIIPNATDAELVLSNPLFGVSRYVVQVINSVGETTSEVAKVECDKKLKLSEPSPDTGMRVTPKNSMPSYVKSAEEIENQRNRLAAEEAQRQIEKKLLRNKLLAVAAMFLLAILVGIAFFVFVIRKGGKGAGHQPTPANSVGASALPPNDPTTNLQTAATASALPQTSNKTDVKVETSHQDKPKNLQGSYEFGLPKGWEALTLGNATNIYYESIDIKPPVRFDLTSAESGFPTNTGSILYVCKTNLGKEFKASLLKVDGDSSSCLNGIMLRDSKNPESEYLFIGASSQKIYVFRKSSDGELASTNMNIPSTYGKPIILFKMNLNNKQYTPSYSLDANQWNPFEHFQFADNQQVLAGFAQSSGSLSAKVTARFAYISPTK